MQNNNTKISWQLLQTFYQAAQSGSIRDASKALGINHSSVSRHISRLEQQLGGQVFERYNTGLRLTPLGQQLQGQVEAMQANFETLQAQLDSMGDEVSGEISLSLGDSLLPLVLPVMQQARREYPALSFAVAVDNGLASLNNGDADIALRITPNPPEHLVGVPLKRLSVNAYCHRDYPAQAGCDLDWIDWLNLPLAHKDFQRYQQGSSERKVAARFDNSSAILAAVKSGLGCAYLLSCLAEAESDLVLVEGHEKVIELDLWLLYHPQMRQSAKVKAVVALFKHMLAPQV